MPTCLIHNDTTDGNLNRKGADEGPRVWFFDFDSSFTGHPLLDVDWDNRDILEVYAQEIDIADVDGLFWLIRKVFFMLRRS
ncbi:unnamed protein product [Chondrus crispus]|uniref:Aminoglycoside phosphotransferase domain-containing protein n=1 Tax=Chondrus crispus TaxID=2769 RepID=R7QAY3_CHOCR|nr:unnamed protein product [Chondrus crispus]CDF35672.1 unnamed protein product [Chondrus crispus]|eukprot:XP_005715491.1 unnamed protein product [Chondrus crispus]